VATADRAADAERWRRGLAANPQDAAAWHNLAAAEGDLGHARAAEEAARRAISLGLAAPETRFVLGRALQDQGRLDEAEAMFEETLALRPAYADAHRPFEYAFSSRSLTKVRNAWSPRFRPMP